MKGGEATQAQLDRLADAVNHRIKELHERTDKEIAERGGPSNTTMTKIRLARTPTPRRGTLENLDDGLSWKRGSSYRVLWEGDAPIPKDDAEESSHPVDRGGVAVNIGGGPLRRLLQIRADLDRVIEELRSE